MKQIFLLFIIITFLNSCNTKVEPKKNEKLILQPEKEKDKEVSQKKEITVEKTKNISDFIPNGFKIYTEKGMNEIKGDLNKDGLEDLVLIIKETDIKNIVIDEYRGKLDRNRRGIIVLFNKGDHYELALENQSCFTSENEDGGVYYAPELDIDIMKGNLYINYRHGRYGYWFYTFKYKKNNFELIGYDSYQHRGPICEFEISYNFITKKKLTRENINKNDEDKEEKFEETWEKINRQNLVKLSDIIDFDELEV